MYRTCFRKHAEQEAADAAFAKKIMEEQEKMLKSAWMEYGQFQYKLTKKRGPLEKGGAAPNSAHDSVNTKMHQLRSQKHGQNGVSASQNRSRSKALTIDEDSDSDENDVMKC